MSQTISPLPNLGGRPVVLSDETKLMIHALRAYGMSFRKIAMLLKIDHVTAWRAYQLSAPNGLDIPPPD
jgi:hypothetical protein